MRILAAVLFIRMASQVGAADKEYDDKTYNDISEVIDFLLRLTSQMCNRSRKNLNIECRR